jgi:hypothetical protein
MLEPARSEVQEEDDDFSDSDYTSFSQTRSDVFTSIESPSKYRTLRSREEPSRPFSQIEEEVEPDTPPPCFDFVLVNQEEVV